MNNQDNTSNGKGYIACSSLEELQQLTRFTPVNGKKPYIKQWQNNPKTISFCENEIKLLKATGYGLITGKSLVTVDFDGKSSLDIALVIGQWLVDAKDHTLAWSSGKDGYYQVAYQIPCKHLEKWQNLTRKAITSYGSNQTIKGQQLEIRYSNCQSVLPPSKHPTNGNYQWLNNNPILSLTPYQSNCLLAAITHKPSNVSNDLSTQDLERLVGGELAKLSSGAI